MTSTLVVIGDRAASGKWFPKNFDPRSWFYEARVEKSQEGNKKGKKGKRGKEAFCLFCPSCLFASLSGCATATDSALT
jgi:hypothetical protein